MILKAMKQLGILLLFAVLFISCEKDNGVVPEKLKETVVTDLKGKVFSAYQAQMVTQGEGAKLVDPENAFFTKMEFVGNVVELTRANNTKSRFGFEINNANRNSEELPDVFSLAMKSDYNNFYIYLNRDYSNATIILGEGNKSYSINLKP
ncbi:MULTISPECIES: hypothetical protein [Sphingobacterium]|uniref:hypothetical protein n=1 Tax=Sphingobacterium TaxID=28453 RepID=UPI000B942A19|nr:hypothetical protein [Sphingobacterium sp. WM]OYD42454.1 hypothetical protein CHT99_06385 [Sphingobacterium cellulitidis]WFB65290.1 hypothetical protein PZ892_08730 [Sphingobacterium sp. WM]